MTDIINSSIPIPQMVRQFLEEYLKQATDLVEKYRGRHIHLCIHIVDDTRTRMLKVARIGIESIVSSTYKLAEDRATELAANRLLLEAMEQRKLRATMQQIETVKTIISRLEEELRRIERAGRELIEEVTKILDEYLEKVNQLEKRCYEPRSVPSEAQANG